MARSRDAIACNGSRDAIACNGSRDAACNGSRDAACNGSRDAAIVGCCRGSHHGPRGRVPSLEAAHEDAFGSARRVGVQYGAHSWRDARGPIVHRRRGEHLHARQCPIVHRRRHRCCCRLRRLCESTACDHQLSSARPSPRGHWGGDGGHSVRGNATRGGAGAGGSGGACAGAARASQNGLGALCRGERR